MTFRQMNLAAVSKMRTGKLNSNAAVENGEYPFFTCAQQTYRIDKFAFDAEAVLLGGNNANGTYPLKYYNGKFNAYQRTYVFESLDKDLLNIRYLFYALMPALERFKAASIGAATQYLTKSLLDNFIINIPDVGMQNKIVAILSAYEDLIENNRRRIALLEEAARQLYMEWFVRFRFPGHEHVKIIDGVPDGWERKALGDLANLAMGQSPKSQFYNQDGNGLPFHQGVTDYRFRFVSHRTYSTAITKLAEPNDILVSVRAPVGRINITLDRIVLGRGLSAVRSKTGNQSFLLYALKEHFYAEDIIGTGAIYAATNKKELESQLLLMPSEHLITSFEDASVPIDRQIANLSQSIEHLTKARDLLLPKLMSGAIAV